MKSFIISILIASAVFLSGCTEDLSVTDPLSNSSELSERILGEWNLAGAKLTFDNSGNFSYTYDLYPFDLNTTVTQTGKYEIIDSVLILKTSKWDFSNPENISSISIVPGYFEISFINGILSLLRVDVFTKEENNKTDLLGTWKMVRWVYHKVSTPELTEYTGRQEEFYNFVSKDSAYHGWNYLDKTKWHNPNWIINYEYKPPDIIIPGPGIYNTEVKFKNGKMYWYRKSYSIGLAKN